jgi:hypothetical protein
LGDLKGRKTVSVVEPEYFTVAIKVRFAFTPMQSLVNFTHPETIENRPCRMGIVRWGLGQIIDVLVSLPAAFFFAIFFTDIVFNHMGGHHFQKAPKSVLMPKFKVA